MRKIRDVLRYRHSTGLSLKAIARALSISKGGVVKYLRLASDAGVPASICSSSHSACHGATGMWAPLPDYAK